MSSIHIKAFTPKYESYGFAIDTLFEARKKESETSFEKRRLKMIHFISNMAGVPVPTDDKSKLKIPQIIYIFILVILISCSYYLGINIKIDMFSNVSVNANFILIMALQTNTAFSTIYAIISNIFKQKQFHLLFKNIKDFDHFFARDLSYYTSKTEYYKMLLVVHVITLVYSAFCVTSFIGKKYEYLNFTMDIFITYVFQVILLQLYYLCFELKLRFLAINDILSDSLINFRTMGNHPEILGTFIKILKYHDMLCDCLYLLSSLSENQVLFIAMSGMLAFTRCINFMIKFTFGRVPLREYYSKWYVFTYIVWTGLLFMVSRSIILIN